MRAGNLVTNVIWHGVHLTHVSGLIASIHCARSALELAWI